MKVFISWSGEQSEALAKALHRWLPLVLHYVDPWLSQADINAGERWGTKVAGELSLTNFGIICVTKSNINAPWLLFESGALAKSMEEGRVIPLLLDIDLKDIAGPLAQFQAKKIEKNGIKDVISAINKIAQNPVLDVRLEQLFESLWSGLETDITNIPKNHTPTKKTRPDSEILEELVSGVRGLEMRLRDGYDDSRMISKRRKGRNMSSGMLMEMAHMIGDSPRDPIQILFAVSMLRDDVPWLYELGVETYKSIKSGKIDEAQSAHRKFAKAIDMLRQTPFMDELLDKQTYIFLRETLSMFEFDLGNYENLKARAVRQRTREELTRKEPEDFL